MLVNTTRETAFLRAVSTDLQIKFSSHFTGLISTWLAASRLIQNMLCPGPRVSHVFPFLKSFSASFQGWPQKVIARPKSKHKEPECPRLE